MKLLKCGSIAVFLLLAVGCGGNAGPDEDLSGGGDSEGDQTSAQSPSVDPEALQRIIKSIPEPLELTSLIQEIGGEYDRSVLNDYDAVTNYKTNYQQALNLGIYSTDLGFANIYRKNQDALSFLNSVKKLADGLRIAQFFDYQEVKKLTESSENLNLLMQKTTQNFERITDHLRNQKRENLSILILTGGWIESLHLSTKVYEKSPDPRLQEKIGEQKLVLDQILLVLDVYRSKPGFDELIRDMTALKKIYDRVNIETRYEPPTVVEKDGKLIIVDNSTSVINIKESDVQAITSLVESVRNKMIR